MIISKPLKILPRKTSLWILFLLPVLFVIISLITRQQIGPYWLGKNFDPEYAYLLNFLNIIELKTPGHTDHPGTPLQIFGGLVIQTTFLIQFLTHSSTSNVIEAVLQNPEFYLLTVNTTLLIIAAGCLLLVGWAAFSLTQNIVLSLLFQLEPFLWTILSESTRVRPEPLLFCLTQLLVILLLFYLYSDKYRLSQFALTTGVVLGLGVATKVTFLPLSLVILLLPGWQKKGLAIFTSIVTFFLATLPISSQYPRLFSWLTSIATHTGQYGGGNQGLVDTSALPSTFTNLVGQDQLFFYIIAFSALNFLIVTFWFGWNRFKSLNLQTLPAIHAVNKFYNLFACLLLIILIQLLLTLKHPAIHYLIPSMGLFSLLILVQVVLLAQLLTPVLKPNILRNIGLFVLGLYAVVIATNAYTRILQEGKSYKSYMVEVQTINRLIQQKYDRCAHVRYYRSSDKEYALKFGDDFAANQFSGTLQSMYPNGAFYNIWSRKYYAFNHELDLNTLLNKKCVILQGSPFSTKSFLTPGEPYAQYIPNVKIKPILEGENQALYLVVQKNGSPVSTVITFPN
jgi:hypothetical protein